MTHGMTEFLAPEIPMVTSGNATPNALITAPTDAILFFEDIEWMGAKTGSCEMTMEEGVLMVRE